MKRQPKRRPQPEPPFRRPTRPLSTIDTQRIYCGDNIDQLPRLPDKCVDLIYVDPPFNSNRVYETFWGETKEKRAFEDRSESTRAYIDYMRPRCLQLARVLKKTGSFYYHCDWHASHYVKVMLDQLMGEDSFQGEIVWRRTNARQDRCRWCRMHDVIFFYTKSDSYHFEPLMVRGDESKMPHTLVTGPDGKKYNTADLTGQGMTDEGESGLPWQGYNPNDFGRHWGYSHSQMDAWDAAGLIHWPKKTGKKGGFPRKRAEKPFEPESRMIQVGDVWTDIDRLNQTSKERIGFPTQKPVALLERILKASSQPDDIVLDAFCGCGTALVAAEKLDRRWIGIDSSPTACRVMSDRLRDVSHLRQDTDFFVIDLPRSEEELRRMPPFEFQNWAVVALGGVPNRKKSGDKGIDGRFYPVASESKKDVKDSEEFGFMKWYPVQVKQRDKAGRPDIDAFETAIQREGKKKGIFVSFGFTSDAVEEIRGFFKRTDCLIVPLTVRELLDVDATELAMKLA
jgi:DNA modification methylase